MTEHCQYMLKDFKVIKHLLTAASFLCLIACSGEEATDAGRIDRRALALRHNVVLTGADSLGALSVGNGDFAFTVDVTGLQSFPEYYENGISLGTQSQWGWHSYPNRGGYVLQDVLEAYETCNGKKIPVAVQHSGGRKAAADWLRANPHRLHLGLIGLELLKEDGEAAAIHDLQNIRQELDLWTGAITSRYELEGVPVQVELYGHQEQDLIAFRLQSPLIAAGRLKAKFRFPYGKQCHVCPGYDWEHPEKHQSKIIRQAEQQAWIQRTLDSTGYAVGIRWADQGTLSNPVPHQFELVPDKGADSFEASVWFVPDLQEGAIPGFEATRQNSREQWEAFWMNGAAVDFSECTDPRAEELERRVVLSQYLTKIQCAGMYPPQETGLTFNSWYGKFHLEMHWWHGVHFALWNRIGLLEKSMGWYGRVMEEARRTAERQGFEGVRWQKMTGPEGRSSPSSVGEFLAWQQPHPIYFAELFYRRRPDAKTLEQFREIVFETADFMASFARYDSTDGKYHLCHPLIPAQEIFPATKTDDPPFELAYWHYGLSTAQEWRRRLGMAENEQWQDVIDKLAPLPRAEALYLPAARATEAYSNHDNRRDHPIVTGVYGMLPGKPEMDTAVMGNTFREVMSQWDWASTWGWDYPMLAMCAARLGYREEAVDALLMEVQKNTYLVNGHNYQDKRLRLYLPGNGGLLTAVAMMSAGWDGSPENPNPGFPDNGTWKVRWEGLERMP
ncbi:MAG: hypothetical protein J5I98_20945 [Phaeodactylibacter sp.]|nr:hypothetical protein [Phaeodactylibacter sp.]